MASLHFSADLDVSAPTAWDFVERYTRSEVHAFSTCVSERQEGEHRVVTMQDGREIWERNVTVDAARMRASYTIPGHAGSEHHHAEMRVLSGSGDRARLEWVTDVLPDDLVPALEPRYRAAFADLVAAVEASVGDDAPAVRGVNA